MTQTAPEPGAPFGVYVHFPWCKRKCPYCDFLSATADRIPSASYTNAVIAELRRRGASLTDRSVSSVYIGGGTPSLWQPRHLGALLDALRGLLRVDSGAEITVEANPSSLDLARARELVDVGVNRLSIGVQSLRHERLRFLGRLHDPAQARAAVTSALQAGIPRVSVDLIYGLPGQRVDEASFDAAELVDLGAEHISAYALTVEPETAFGRMAREGTLAPAHEDDVADAFLAIRGELIGRGFEHYELSNYALPGRRARHNTGYWVGMDYLGLGCAAWGTLTQGGRVQRYRNTPSPNEYIELASSWSGADLERAGEGLLQSELEELTLETRRIERLMLGLRLADGIDIEGVARELGIPALTERGARAYEHMLKDGSLECSGGRTRIAPHLWFVADSIVAQLV